MTNPDLQRAMPTSSLVSHNKFTLQEAYWSRQWRELEIIAIVAEEGSISQASQRLFISQPALSRQIHKLELRLGIKLFDRSVRGSSLTNEGNLFLIEIRRLLTELDQTNRVIQAIRLRNPSAVRLAAPYLVLRFVVAPALLAYSAMFPGLDLEVVEIYNYDTAIEFLTNDTVQIAIVGSRVLTERLGFDELLCARVYAVVSSTHKLASRPFVTLEDLEEERVLLFSKNDSGPFSWEDPLGYPYSEKVFTTHEPDTLLLMVEGGFGVALMPDTVNLGNRRVKAIPFLKDGRQRAETQGLAWRMDRKLPHTTKVFMEVLKQQAAQRDISGYEPWQKPEKRQVAGGSIISATFEQS